METEEIIKVIKLDPSQRGILIFRGISREDVEKIIDAIKKWLETDRPFCFASLPSMDMDVRFERVGLEEEQ